MYDDEKQHISIKNLLDECQKPHTYSVPEAAQKIGLDYSKIKESEDKEYKYILELCHDHCFFNAEEAAIKGVIETEVGMRYCVENSSIENPLREYYVNELNRIERERLQHAKEVIVIAQENKVLNNRTELVQDTREHHVTAKDSTAIKELHHGQPGVRFKFSVKATYNVETNTNVCALERVFDAVNVQDLKHQKERNDLPELTISMEGTVKRPN
jgi:hypothetical protein